MATPRFPTILVFGAQGMLGHTVYNFLKNAYPSTTWGTVRKRKNNNKHLLHFDAYELKNLEIIFEKLKKIDYIINCIGILQNNTNSGEMGFINGIFPHKLALLAEKYNSKLIHISTDAVFSKLAGNINEDVRPSPENIYGKTKLQGEPSSPNAISIRTSILGYDPNKHKGFLEFILHDKNIKGFSNQLWSGCTTLQFAKLCELIINHNTFQNIRDHSHVFHFSPIRKTTKHDIIKTFLQLNKNKKRIKKITNKTTTRVLASKYQGLLFADQFQNDLKTALQDLILFENRK